MHAYLLIGEESQTSKEAGALATKLKTITYEFPLKKIEDVRQLNSFVGLSLKKPTAIIAKNVEQATVEALNAFLKNLEEPQETLFFILTASSLAPLPSTIVSRCQVILLKSTSSPEEKIIASAEEFLEASEGERLAIVSGIKDRQGAKDFTNGFILGCHSLMRTANRPTIYSRAIRAASFTRRALEANGNVSAQLANLAVSLV
jgi:hypothetical protein